MNYLSVSNKHKCPTCYLQSVPLLGSLRRVGHFRDTNLSGNGFSVSCDIWGEGMKKPSETSFQRVCLDFVLLLLWTLSGKRDSIMYFLSVMYQYVTANFQFWGH